jgi:hypothetical protein
MSQLNHSTSKELHAFAKTARFPPISSVNRSVTISSQTYNKVSDFDKIVKKGTGKDRHSFGTRHDRFAYSPSFKKNGTVGP